MLVTPVNCSWIKHVLSDRNITILTCQGHNIQTFASVRKSNIAIQCFNTSNRHLAGSFRLPADDHNYILTASENELDRLRLGAMGRVMGGVGGSFITGLLCSSLVGLCCSSCNVGGINDAKELGALGDSGGTEFLFEFISSTKVSNKITVKCM